MKFSEAIKALRSAGIKSPRREAQIIFEELCGIKGHTLVYTDCESPLADEAVKRRCAKEPLQYIIGRVSFYREEYFVTPDCLIPRQDTEILVDVAVSRIKEGESFIDLCTGSGCVAISTLKNTKNTRAVAVDISDGAKNIAERNAAHNGVSDRIEILRHDAISSAVDGSFYALLSNPPYISEADYAGLEKEIFHEPKIALVADDNGLLFYKRLIPLYKDRILRGGFMAFEIGYDQGDALRQIARENGLCAEILKDYSNNDRVALINL